VSGELYLSLLCDTGQNDEALDHYQKALSLYEGTKKGSIEIAVSCRLLGECFCKLGELDKALSLHKRYLELAR